MIETTKPHSKRGIESTIIPKLESWSGEGNIVPATLGFSIEDGKRISKQFVERALRETDIGAILDGIIPAESVFNPDLILDQILTSGGIVKIEKVGEGFRFLGNVVSKLLKINTAAAKYDPDNKKISITSKLNRFSTIAAVSKADFGNIVGPAFAHEALHAHQDIAHTPLGQIEAAESLKRALAIQGADPGLSIAEAIQLEGRSRDLAIITEVQAFILTFMLTGGSLPPDRILNIRSTLDQAKTTEVQQQLMVNGILLSKYSENGFPPILDLVINNVKTYLPKKDQDSPDYLKRIRSAIIQMIRMLGQGANHLQIADKIRENYQQIQVGTEWDEESQSYRFLQTSGESLVGSEIDDDSLLRKFDDQTETRVMKLTQIAKELLMSG